MVNNILFFIVFVIFASFEKTYFLSQDTTIFDKILRQIKTVPDVSIFFHKKVTKLLYSNTKLGYYINIIILKKE